MEKDDQQAVVASQRGERGAFDLLVDRYQKEIYRLCYRYVNDPQDASDLAQEVFLRAYRALDAFRGESSFSTWIYRIAVNTCLSFRARRKRATEELPESIPDGRESVVLSLERQERAREIRAAIEELPEKQRATLILKMYHELSHEEIAGIMGSSVGTVKANLFHAFVKLKRRLGAMEEK